MTAYPLESVPIDGEKVATYIRIELARRHVTQRALAHYIGTNEFALSRLLAGLRQWTPDRLDKVAEYFGVPTTTVLAGAE